MINITIGWEWALGIFGLLILIAWKGSARLAALETSMDWVKNALTELKAAIDNMKASKPAFGARMRQEGIDAHESADEHVS